MERTGCLVISLDFELLWGVFDKVEHKEKELYFENTRKVIPEILQLFSEYGIHGTWAAVGMLFNRDWEEWKDNIPALIPDYDKRHLSAYHFGNSIASPRTSAYCFDRDSIEMIRQAPDQEIATHTYSHYYCLEPGQTVQAFRVDMEKSIKVAREMGVDLKSLVFPRNQFNEDYLKICYDLGIENVRSNPSAWYWRDTEKESLKNKIFRTGDAYIGRKNKSYGHSTLKAEPGKPLAQKASRLLRPYTSNVLLNFLKIRRIKSEMTKAARNNEIYHLWWHPHNFGYHPDENLNDLKIILEHFRKCQRKYDFRSACMNELKPLVHE